MTTLMTRNGNPVASAAVATLRGQLDGRLLMPEDTGYESSRRIWNAMIALRPGAILTGASAADVSRAVRFAADHDVEIAVKGGGHNIAGLALTDGGLTLDLSTMKSLVVDRTKRVARAGAGLTWGEFDRGTQQHGLATTGGAVSTTGIAGLTLGGGFGWLMSRCGYTIDNLLGADVVLADGRLVTASAGEHADLFWALRGGGGNFGVVTSFTYRLHEVGLVLAGMLVHSLERLPALLGVYREAAAVAPDDLTLYAAVLTLPTGDRACALLPVWSGDVREGERHLAALRAFGSPLLDTVQPMPYVALQSMLDAAVPGGRHNYWKSGFVHSVPDDAAAVLLAHASRMTSPYGMVLLEHIHGAPTRVPGDATALSIRDELFDCVVATAWDPETDGAEHVAWARALHAALQPWSAGRVYGNILTADEAGRSRDVYGANLARLADVKAEYDPWNLFRRNQNIKPAPQAV